MKGITQHNIFFLQIAVSCCCAKCRYAGCRYTECRGALPIYPAKIKHKPRNTYWRGRTSTIDLQVLSFSDQLLLVQETYIFRILQNKESKRTEPSPSVRVPWIDQQPNLVLFWVKCASVSVSFDKMICHHLNFGQIWSIFSVFIWQTNSLFQNVFYLLQLVESLTLGYKRLLFI